MNATRHPALARPVRFSHLKAYGKSGAHGYHARTAAEDDQTYAMERGTAVHAILFETKQVCGYPGPTRHGKKYEAFVAEHQGYEILTGADFDKARRMADTVRSHKLAWPLLQGAREETILFRWNGMECRSTPDVRGADFITELKSSASADPGRFVYHATRKMHYPAQMRLESLAVERRHGRAPADCYIVCVEQSEPHPVQVFRVEERALEDGYKKLVLWSERLKVCEESGLYPPYTEVIAPIDVEDEEEDTGLVFPAQPAPRTAGRFGSELGDQP